MFTPQACTVCPTFTEVDWSYNSSELPQDPNCAAGTCPHYINNLYHWRTLLANKWVKQFQFRVDTFDLESGYDYFEYGETGALSALTGSLSPGWRGVVSSDSVQKLPINLLLRTDISVTRPGFRLGKARVCCSLSAPIVNPVPNRNLLPLDRTTGVLLGPKDTVYATIPVGPSTRKQSISLWGPPGTDFDVYLRCNAAPTPSAWDVRGFSGDSQETIVFQQPGGCTYPGTWYIAINSYAGSGQFDLVTSPMYNAGDVSLRAGFNWNAPATQVAASTAALLRSSRQFFGQTEGQILIRQFDIWNNTGTTCGNCGGVACDICFLDQPGTGSCCAGPNGQVHLMQSYFNNGELIAHEYGHKYMSGGDEYDGFGGVWQCGHSNMANPVGSQNNFCIDADHNSDATPGATVSPLSSVWTSALINGKVPVGLVTTGDNYDYSDHDFNGLIQAFVH